MQSFGKLQQRINSFIKLVSWVWAVKFRFAKSVSCRLFVPVCLSCCFAVIGQCLFETVDVAKRQEVLELDSSRVDGIYGILSSDRFFVGTEVDNHIRVNTFKVGVNYVSELFRSFEVISPSVAYADDGKGCQNIDNPSIQGRDREDYAKKIYELFQFWIPLWFVTWFLFKFTSILFGR